MPRNRERITNRQSRRIENMEQAIDEVMTGGVGYLNASKTFHIPQSSLDDRISKAKQQNFTPTAASTKGMGRYRSVFSEQQEHEKTNAKSLLTKVMTLQILNASSEMSYAKIPKAKKGGCDALNAEDDDCCGTEGNDDFSTSNMCRDE
ncbi:hypothetical protein JTB14_026707 [Gonioctena quinquepunctata]|nr:hypothetical protein JTB14_026707 [Gonioctena quinquepunctata]